MPDGRRIFQRLVSDLLLKKKRPHLLLGQNINGSSNLPAESLEALVDSLLDEIPEDVGSTIVIAVKSENAPASPVNGQQSQKRPVYDPAIAYVLEFCTVLALRDTDTVELFGKRVVDALQAVLRDVGSYHPILVARATFYLFRLLQFSYVRLPTATNHAV